MPLSISRQVFDGEKQCLFMQRLVVYVLLNSESKREKNYIWICERRRQKTLTPLEMAVQLESRQINVQMFNASLH